MNVYVICADTDRGLKEVLDRLDLELQAAMSHLIWVLVPLMVHIYLSQGVAILGGDVALLEWI